MADYTPWDINDYMPGQPLTSSKAISFHENLDASFEGAPGAPRIWLPAFERVEAGTQIRSRNDVTVSVSGSNEDIVHQFGFIQFGTIRAEVEKISGAGVRWRRVRAGVNSVLFNATENAVVTRDIDVIPGDTVIIAVYGDGTGASARNGRFLTGGQDLWPGPLNVAVEGNRAAP